MDSDKSSATETEMKPEFEYIIDLAIATLLFGIEIWTMKDSDKSSARETEMTFLSNSAECTQFDDYRNRNILKRIKTRGALMQINSHDSAWIKHVGGVDN